MTTIEKTIINRSILNGIDVLREINIEVYMSKKYIHLLLPYIDEGKELFERIKGLDLEPELNNLFQELSYLADKWDVEPDNMILRPKFNHEHLLYAPKKIYMPWYLLERKNAQNGSGEKMKIMLPGRR